MKKLYSESTYKYCNSENGFLTIRIKELYKPSSIRKRGLIPECTKSEIRKYFHEYAEKHGKICFYCKKPWTYITNKHFYKKIKDNRSDRGKSRIKKIKNFSIDRLDNSKTYSIDNIIFCCVGCNLSKKDISISLIKRLYEIIMERNL